MWQLHLAGRSRRVMQVGSMLCRRSSTCVCRWDASCTEAILKEAGTQLTSLAVEVVLTHTPASWLTHLSGLRELKIQEFVCHTMATANFSHMTVCASHVHMKSDAPVCRNMAS